MHPVVYSTVDRGHVHVAIDTHYQGDINSYNWWFTKFFSWLFGTSMDVTVGNKVRRLNKNSYVQFLLNHGVQASRSTLNQFTNFDSLPCTASQNMGPMRNFLTAEKVNSLTRKLVYSMHDHNIDRATTMIGKGAAVDTHFLLRHMDDSFWFSSSCTTDLPAGRVQAFTYSRLTPLLYAAMQNQQPLVHTLRRFGASQQIGEKFTFQRDILDVHLDNTLQPTVQQVFVERGRRTNRHLEVRNRYGVNLETSQRVQLQDYSQKTHDLVINAYNTLSEIVNPAVPQTHVWESRQLVGSTRVV